MTEIDYDILKRYADCEQDEELIRLRREGHTVKECAKLIGIGERTAYRSLKNLRERAALKGYDPEANLTTPLSDAESLFGTSSLYRKSGENGEPILQWVKTKPDQLAMLKLAEAVRDGLTENIEKAPKQVDKFDLIRDEDTMNLHTISDYHLGMFASVSENLDTDWDSEKAEEVLLAWFEQSIKLAPPASVGVLLNLGDFFTSDSVKPVTPTHGHLLDVDRRFQDMIRIGIRSFKRIVEMMREKYETVYVYHISGNHDETSGMWLRETFSFLYEDADDVIVSNNAINYDCMVFGDNSFFFHHGHKRSAKNIVDGLLGYYRDVIGKTVRSYIHLGHRHSIEKERANGIMIEQHRTLAPNDAHASNGGWSADSSSNVITYHRTYGETSRVTITRDMVVDYISGS